MRRACMAVGFLMVASVGVGLFSTRTNGQPAAAGTPDANHKKITVTGIGTVAVKPDTARVSFAVKGTGADFKAAVADCDKRADAVKKSIAGLKLNGLEVKFGPINLLTAPVGPGGGPMPGGPPMPGAPPGQPGPAAVEVTRTFTVVATFGGKNSAGELKDIVTVSDQTLAAAMSAGATEPPAFTTVSSGGQFGGGPFGGGVGGGNSRIEFSRSNVAQLRQDALKLAVADAIANAKVAGGIANLTAKDIVALSDQVPNTYGLGVPANTGRGEVLGEQELTVQVIVTFNY